MNGIRTLTMDSLSRKVPCATRPTSSVPAYQEKIRGLKMFGRVIVSKSKMVRLILFVSMFIITILIAKRAQRRTPKYVFMFRKPHQKMLR